MTTDGGRRVACEACTYRSNMEASTEEVQRSRKMWANLKQDSTHEAFCGPAQKAKPKTARRLAPPGVKTIEPSDDPTCNRVRN